jgi:CheY-like chemotaxis protein
LNERRDSLPPESISELRHELRTPVNHIVGYCEMLLEDAVEADRTEHQVALEDTLGVARDVLNLINTGLPPSEDEVPRRSLIELVESLREPQRRIVNIMTSLLDSGAPTEESFADDVRRIIGAAEQLVGIEPGKSTSATGDGTNGGGSPSSEAAEVEATGSQARVLVVDDNEDNRAILERRLIRQGYAVECAENGSRALAMLAARPFDLVLLDVMMPEVDGYEVLQKVKANPQTRDIPVIMISALDDLGSIVRCIEDGAEDYLPKPFDPVLLKARISASLEKKRLRDVEKEYLEKVNSVIAAASAVESGTYEAGSLSEIAHRDDELGRLARVFDKMADEVKAREERLRQQVDDLRKVVEETHEAPRQAVSSRDAELDVGGLFAERYDILDVIDGGGMGMVYKARDRELDDEIAIKTLHSDLISDDERMIDRFKSEIRLARLISHPSVVRTHDFGKWDGIYYLTMEYVEGVTARQLLAKRGSLAVSSTLAIATQLARSLEVAHEQGVIHRDIKPQNLLLDKDGNLKVLDFGVACLTERSGNFTEAGLVVGTPAYMAPEQLLDETAEERSDLYAVGVVLYECLTGKLPFEGGSSIALIAKQLNEDPTPPDQVNPEVPPELSALIVRLLSKSPDDRPASASELGELLAQVG